MRITCLRKSRCLQIINPRLGCPLLEQADAQPGLLRNIILMTLPGVRVTLEKKCLVLSNPLKPGCVERRWKSEAVIITAGKNTAVFLLAGNLHFVTC